MDQSPYLEANSRATSQKVLRLYGTRTFMIVFTTARHWPLP